MTNTAYEATNSDVEKLTRALVASAMLSSIEDYLFEILDSVENDIGKLTAEDSYTLNAWVRSAVEKAAEELESQPLCVKSNDAMREAASLCVKLPMPYDINVAGERVDWEKGDHFDRDEVIEAIRAAGIGVKGE